MHKLKQVSFFLNKELGHQLISCFSKYLKDIDIELELHTAIQFTPPDPYFKYVGSRYICAVGSIVSTKQNNVQTSFASRNQSFRTFFATDTKI